MTGILSQLVGRASGQQWSRLRPRIAARFESGDPGLIEITETRPAADAPEPTSPPRVATVSEEAGHTPAQGPSPEASAADRAPPAPLMSPHPSRARSKGPPERQSDPQDLGPPDRPGSPHEPASLQDKPAGPAETDFHNDQPTERPPRAQPTVTYRMAAPAPLLPERQWIPPFDPPVDAAPRVAPPALRRTEVAQPAPRRTEAAQPAPPEITIHIGRIDLRQAPEPAADQPKPRRESKVTALGDYLKGTGG